MVERDRITKLACIRRDERILPREKRHSRTSMLFLFVLIVVIENSGRRTYDRTTRIKISC
jgi:hypothetical protein